MQNLNETLFRKPEIHSSERVIWQNGFYYKPGHFEGYQHTVVDNLATNELQSLLNILKSNRLSKQNSPEDIVKLDSGKSINLKYVLQTNRENIQNWLNNYQTNILPNIETGIGDNKLILNPAEIEYLEVKANLYSEIEVIRSGEYKTRRLRELLEANK